MDTTFNTYFHNSDYARTLFDNIIIDITKDVFADILGFFDNNGLLFMDYGDAIARYCDGYKYDFYANPEHIPYSDSEFGNYVYTSIARAICKYMHVKMPEDFYEGSLNYNSPFECTINDIVCNDIYKNAFSCFIDDLCFDWVHESYA